MNEIETQQLREALNVLLDIVPSYDESLSDVIRDFAYKGAANHTTPMRKEVNAARCVARFLEWDDVPGDVT